MFQSPFSRPGVALAMICAGVAANTASADVASSNVMRAGEINTMVHQAAASVCMIEAGVMAQAERDALAELQGNFDGTLTALAADGLTSEVEAIRAQWDQTDAAIVAIVNNEGVPEHVAAVTESRAALEFATLSLLDRAANAYEGSEGVTMVDVVTVDLAERQDVLIQKMKFMACDMAAGDVTADARAALKDTVQLFDATLAALTNGRPEMGIGAPEDYAVQQILAASAYDWRGMKSVLEDVAASGTVTPDDLASLRGRADTLDGRMTALVSAYLSPAEPASEPQVASLDAAAD